MTELLLRNFQFATLDLQKISTRGFWVLSFLFLLGTVVGDTAFIKMGIQLSLGEGWGGIPFFQPKIFVTEMYIFFCFLLFTLQKSGSIFREVALTRDMLSLITGAIFVLGILRMIPDLTTNPLLVIRNSGFTWYMIFPFFLALYDVEVEQFEIFFKLFSAVVLLIVAFHLIKTVSILQFHDLWFSAPFGGIPYLVLIFHPSYWGLTAISSALLGFNLGIDMQSKLQRTIWLGLFLALPMILKKHKTLANKKLGPGVLALFCLFLLLGVFSRKLCKTNFFSSAITAATSSSANSISSRLVLKQNESDGEMIFPWNKGETKNGLEVFRVSMWNDALKKWLSAPLFGIGMLKPVVDRYYMGSGIYRNNIGNSDGNRSPVSGPHNGYLNALARMGILGGLVFMLHILAAYILWKNNYVYCFGILISGIVYSFFNVGIEGPARSFMLIFALIPALKLARESPQWEIGNILKLKRIRL